MPQQPAKPRVRKYRELKKVLKRFGIIILTNRGKGSERMLFQESTNMNYPLKCHNENQEYSKPVQKAIMRRFSLPDTFWN